MRIIIVGIKNALREHIPLQQGLRPFACSVEESVVIVSESIFHYNKD